MTDECCGFDENSDSARAEDAEFTDAIDELARSEKRLLAALKTPEATAEFLDDPSKFLRRLKISVPAVVEHRLRLPRVNRAENLTASPGRTETDADHGFQVGLRIRVARRGRERQRQPLGDIAVHPFRPGMPAAVSGIEPLARLRRSSQGLSDDRAALKLGGVTRR